MLTRRREFWCGTSGGVFEATARLKLVRGESGAAVPPCAPGKRKTEMKKLALVLSVLLFPSGLLIRARSGEHRRKNYGSFRSRHRECQGDCCPSEYRIFAHCDYGCRRALREFRPHAALEL